MSEMVQFVDTTLRDGQQSLWAFRMRSRVMLPAIAEIDRAGFAAIEFNAPAAQFARALRDLGENPWDWMKYGTEQVERAELRMHGSPASPFRSIPRSVQSLLLTKFRELGVSVTRTSDWWNNFERLEPEVRFMEDHGVRTVVNLIYSVSPRHTIDYYRRKIAEAVATRPYRICVKDVGGLMTPDVARELLPLMVELRDGCELEFHAHGNTGTATYNTNLAVDAGIRIVHTAIPPLACGSSLPSVFAVAANLEARGYTPMVNLDGLTEVSEHLHAVAAREDLPVGEPADFDDRLFHHQVPGGMISNFKFQLSQIGLGDRLGETLEETAQVRADFGYPIMVTPLSQFVATQAALNIASDGPRYSVVSDETIEYALGAWGDEAVEYMDPDARDRILASPRATAIRARLQDEAPEPDLATVRSRYGSSVTDEELLVRMYAGVDGDHQLPPSDPTLANVGYAHPRLSVEDLLRTADDDVRFLAYRGPSSSILFRR